jgi:hypothetical protein
MDGEVEDGEAELLACSVSSGEAWNGGFRRRLELGFRRALGRTREGEGENGDVLGQERKSRAFSWRPHLVEGGNRRWRAVPREPPRRCFMSQRRRQRQFAKIPLVFWGFLVNFKTEQFLH